MAQAQYIGTGRRKNSTARVRLVPGTGKIVFNKKDMEDYIPFPYLYEVIKQPLNITDTLGSYDVHVNVNGGGFTGQAGAARRGSAAYVRRMAQEPAVAGHRHARQHRAGMQHHHF